MSALSLPLAVAGAASAQALAAGSCAASCEALALIAAS